MIRYGTRVGLLNDLCYAEGTVVGFDLKTERYEVEVDRYGKELVYPEQLKILEDKSK